MSWASLASGTNAVVYSLYYRSDIATLYVGGSFTQASGVDVFGIASWETTGASTSASIAVGTSGGSSTGAIVGAVIGVIAVVITKKNSSF